MGGKQSRERRAQIDGWDVGQADTNAPESPWATQLRRLMAEQPLVSIEEAIQPIRDRGVVKDLDSALSTALAVAEARLQRLACTGAPPADVDVNMAAAVKLYTQEISPVPLYTVLAQAMGTGNNRQSEIGAFLPFIKLLDTALLRLPVPMRTCAAAPNTVYRGTKWRYPSVATPDAVAHFPVGSLRTLFTFQSCSVNRSVALEFITRQAATGPQSCGTLFEMELLEAYHIAQLSDYPTEEEALAGTLTWWCSNRWPHPNRGSCPSNTLRTETSTPSRASKRSSIRPAAPTPSPSSPSG
eukprot:TRINITY_DN6563_c0_g1_i1.p1 TRINITY_DN6563_c0_g1~~TRINITY_DN6563_c0_g1_i1.p1  ORF type:complete len:298 (+),score=33.90 TRINITY_DN6563_c0_g1_i1:51-944(+)